MSITKQIDNICSTQGSETPGGGTDLERGYGDVRP